MKKYVYFFGDGKADGEAEMKGLLGGKGANLAEMVNIKLPVPAGFTISTEVCTYYYANKRSYPKELTGQVVAALKQRFPNIAAPKKADICYATQNRQDAVKVMAPQVDLVIVIGSQTSSNSNRLREVAERFGVPAHLVDSADDVDPAWLKDRRRIGVTAGASAPESLVQALIDRLRSLGASRVRVLEGVEEHVVFPLPKGLGRTALAEPVGNPQ
jgi:4-hydroxy-3-methylbut-2-enyl diphosphate reductase